MLRDWKNDWLIDRLKLSEWYISYTHGQAYKHYVAPAWSHLCKYLRSSSQTVWPLRNIYLSNNNGSFPFYIAVCHSSINCNTFLALTIWKRRRVSSKIRDCLPFAGTWVHPAFSGTNHVARPFSVLWFVFVFFVLCLVPVVVCFSELFILNSCTGFSNVCK